MKNNKCNICGYISKYNIETEDYNPNRLRYLMLIAEYYYPKGKRFTEVESKLNKWLETLNKIEQDEKAIYNNKNSCLLDDINHVRKHWLEALNEIQKGKNEGLIYTSKVWDKEQQKYIQ